MVNVKLSQHRLTMCLETSKERASAGDTLHTCQSQMRGEGAIFGWIAKLCQVRLERLLYLSQKASHIPNTHPQDPWTRFVWKDPHPRER
jgi:hypothetical protein